MTIEIPDRCELPADPLTTQSAVVLIEPGRDDQFRKTLAKLNAKAASFGLTPITVRKESLVVYERVIEQLGNSDKLEAYLRPLAKGAHAKNPVRLKRFEIEFPIVKLGNWQVVGKLEAIGSGNLQFHVTKRSGDANAIADFASRAITCQHCNLKRHRKDSFILREHGTGSYMQVGGSCLKDFTGIDPSQALFLAKMWEVLRDEEGEMLEYLGSGRSNCIGTREFLAAVSYLASTQGFVSAAKARDLGIPATFDDAIGLPRQMSRDEKLLNHYLAGRDKHLQVADDIRLWATGLPLDSSFNFNLQLLLKEETLAINTKHLAFAAASWAMFSKANEEKKAVATSRHVGTTGEKLTCQLTLRRAIPMDTPYGVSYLVLLRDEQGNQITWKTSAPPRVLLDPDERPTFEASFKVKSHGDYKGVCQTAVTHLKVMAMAEAAL